MPKLLGIDKGEGDFFEQLRHVLSHLAVRIMLVGFAEGLGAAKTYAAREGYEIGRQP